MIKKILFACIILLAAVSCSTPKDVAYLQDIQENISIKPQTPSPIRFLPGDKLSIIVHSRDEQLTRLFNISNTTSNSSNSNRFYSVDQNGQIDFPVLGLIPIKGMTREEVARTIKYRLVSGNLCNDPIVTVEFVNMHFSVLGEVKQPGEKEIDKDITTIFEAIAKSGDLSIQGQRKNVLVLRQEGERQTPYFVDLTNTTSIYASPVYYIKQNDVLIVEPNAMQKRQTLATGNSSYTPGFWISIASFLTSMIILIAKL